MWILYRIVNTFGNIIIKCAILDTPSATPPAKRPNKDPMPSHRPTPEQYAAMISAAAAAGQPLPKHHVRIIYIVNRIRPQICDLMEN